MRYKSLIYILLPILASLIPGCAEEASVPGVEMPVHIRIPVDAAASRDLPGDPGNSESWTFPTHAYVYLVTYASEADAAAESGMTCSYRHFVLNPDRWVYDEAASDIDNGIVIYRYPDLSVSMVAGAAVGRVYVALSNTEIPLNSKDLSTESRIRELTFDIPSALVGSDNMATPALEEFLKNLYSTPVNHKYTDLKGELAQYNGKYYGTILNMSDKQPFVDIVCYHVAAKLDIMWNVTPDAQASKKVKSMAVDGLYRKNASIFDPSVNAGVSPDDTYSQKIAVGVGNQWYGRSSVYVLQKQSTPRFSFSVGINNDAPKTVTADVTYDTASPFTSWIRGTITINQSS